MENSILNGSYEIGVKTRNIVLNTLGKVYVKVQDRYYELDFKTSQHNNNNVVVTNTNSEARSLPEVKDGTIIISKEGSIFYSQSGSIFELALKFDPIIKGPLIIENEDQPAIIVKDSTKVCLGLNSEFLNGHPIKDFVLKNAKEKITYDWTFLNPVFIEDKLINNNSNTILDFEKSTLVIDHLTIRKSVSGLNFEPNQESLLVLDENKNLTPKNDNWGFYTASFISCKGFDPSASSSSTLTRSDLFDILSGEPLDGEYINTQFLHLDDYVTEEELKDKGYLTGISKSDVITALEYTPLAKTDFSDFIAVSKIISSDIDNWNFIYGLIGLSVDQTYIFPKNDRGIVSNSFISCKGLDETAPQVGGTFDRGSLFDILSGEPQSGEFINLEYLDLSTYATQQ